MSPNKQSSDSDRFNPLRHPDPIGTLSDPLPVSSPPAMKPDTVAAGSPDVAHTAPTRVDVAVATPTQRTSLPLPPPLPRARPQSPHWGRWTALSALVGIALLTVVVNNRGVNVPQLPQIPPQRVAEGETLNLDLTVVNRELYSNLHYSLVGFVPPTMQIGEETGLLTWPSHEVHGPGTFAVRVRVADGDDEHRSSESTFQIVVDEVHRPPSLRAVSLSDLQLEDGIYSLRFSARDRDFPEGPVTFDFELNPLPDGLAEIDPVTGLFTWSPAPQDFDRTYQLTYRASKSASAVAERQLTLALPEPGQGIERGKGLTYPFLVRLLKRAPLEVDQAGQQAFATGTLWRVNVATATMLVFEYDSARSARRAKPSFGSDAGGIAPELLTANKPARVYQKDRLIVVALGDHPQALYNFHKILGPPLPFLSPEQLSAE